MSKTTDTATYTPCPECGWRLQPTDDHCADCGRLRRQPSGVGVGTALGVGVGATLGSRVSGRVGTIVGGVVGGVVGAALGGVAQPRRAPTFLRQQEARLQGQVRTLAAEQSLLQSLLQRIADRLSDLGQRGQAAGTLPGALRALEETLIARARQIQRHRITQHRITLLRWRNQLEPLLADPSQAAPDVVSSLAWRAQKRLSALEREGLIDTPEGSRLAAQWQQEIEDCEALENDLLAYQTLRAVKGVRPLAEEAPRDDLEQHLAAFSQREYLGELEAELLELEDERQRLTGEEEALAEVENLLR